MIHINGGNVMKTTEEHIRRIIKEELSKLGMQYSADTRVMDVGNTAVYLTERTGRRSPMVKTGCVSFGSLMEQHNKGVITEAHLLRLWERSTIYEMEQLLTEGVMDSLKSAYETVKGGAIKLKDKISDAALAAWEKVNDWVLKISLQAMNLAQASVEGIVKAARMLSNAVQKFKDEHPILFKIIMILVIMIIIFGIMSLFSGQAHAAVKMKGGKHMSQKHYEALRGALSEHGGSDVDKIMKTGDAIKILDKAFKAKESIPISKLGGFNRAGSDMITKLVGQARGGDSQAFELLEKWSGIGAKLTIRTTGG